LVSRDDKLSTLAKVCKYEAWVYEAPERELEKC
jgi:hypothetical protein